MPLHLFSGYRPSVTRVRCPLGINRDFPEPRFFQNSFELCSRNIGIVLTRVQPEETVDRGMRRAARPAVVTMNVPPGLSALNAVRQMPGHTAVCSKVSQHTTTS